jgi:hypothetical protein
MEQSFIAALDEFLAANGKNILEKPERLRALFLDFFQGKYRAETQIFSRFLASREAMELRNSDDVDPFLLHIVSGSNDSTVKIRCIE